MPKPRRVSPLSESETQAPDLLLPRSPFFDPVASPGGALSGPNGVCFAISSAFSHLDITRTVRQNSNAFNSLREHVEQAIRPKRSARMSECAKSRENGGEHDVDGLDFWEERNPCGRGRGNKHRSVIVFMIETVCDHNLNFAKQQRYKTASPGGEFVFGDAVVNFSAMEARRNGQPVALTALEFKVLKYMIQNESRVLSRDELLNRVWGYQNYPRTRSLDNVILRLRKKLEREPSRPIHFRTVHGVGYRFLLHRDQS